MARAEGERDEARRAAADAYQRLAGHEALLIETTVTASIDRRALEGVRALLTEYRADLAMKGIDWHPKFRKAVELVVDQLGQALARGFTGATERQEGDGDAASTAGQRQ